VAGTTVRAHVTVTFGAYKPACSSIRRPNGPGSSSSVDIGSPRLPPRRGVEALQAADGTPLLAPVEHRDRK